MKRSLVLQNGDTQKFWQVEVIRMNLTVTHGTVGTEGQSFTTPFKSKIECLKEANRLTNEKMKEGYKKAGDDTAMPDTVDTPKGGNASMEAKLHELYGEIANNLNSFIPVEWEKIYLYGEVGKNQAHYSVSFYYVASNGDIKRGDDLENSGRVSEVIFDNFIDELEEMTLALNNCFKEAGQELWEQVSFTLENSGKFDVQYFYDVIHKNDGGSLPREVVWAHKTFGFNPPEGNYLRQLLDQYKDKKPRGFFKENLQEGNMNNEKDFVMDKNGIITKYTGTETNVVIPAEIGKIAVRVIGASAFGKMSIDRVKGKMIEHIVIPEGVIEIVGGAFRGNSFTDLTLPESVTTIGDCAFANNKINALVFSENVTEIGDGAFQDNKIKTLTLPKGLTAIGCGAFSVNKLTELVIPSDVTKIGAHTFSENQLVQITLPENLTEIGENAFAKNKLTEIVIPNKVTQIANYAFSGNKLTSITIGGNVSFTTSSFSKGFKVFYDENGKKAGKYVFDGENWNTSA
ncbi:MAG: DUF600 family protein [Treponema sp.]|jgi:uncharacterized protein (TIGR01741 family)|nr:DUF600 family protein [Treponema sp.]